jgi:hypothetical protein
MSQPKYSAIPAQTPDITWSCDRVSFLSYILYFFIELFFLTLVLINKNNK